MSPPGDTRRIAVVGAGWAGLATAVRATQAGHGVTLFEMAGQPGGRARALAPQPDAGTPFAAALPMDNGQHILIGAYARTLDLMGTVGVDSTQVLYRQPLSLRYPDGRGLSAPPGTPVPSFLRAVLGANGWRWGDKMSLLARAGGWALRGFRCDPTLTVAQLCAGLPPRVRELLIDPLCVAALNTPADQASAAVLLRVLRDALFGGKGSADLLLPRRPLSELLPNPAATWLQRHGATLHCGHRVQALAPAQAGGWTVDGQRFDAVVLACTAAEAARLAGPHAPAWSAQAAALRYEPIVTVLLHWPGARLPAPMTALIEGPDAPAQFAFDHGALGATPGRFAFVVSGARRWVQAGLPATGQAVLRQSAAAFGGIGGCRGTLPAPVVERVLADKRATFACTPGLQRPPLQVAPGLLAAGDYVAGPYPATLEGAVRAGEAAVAALAQG